MTEPDPPAGSRGSHRPSRRTLWWVTLVAAFATGGVLLGAVEGKDAGTPGQGAPPSTTSSAGASATRTSPSPVPSGDPPVVVCDAQSLRGPATPPPGAVVVRRSDDLDRVTRTAPPGTTFWLEPGVHDLGDGRYEQVQPRDGNRYVGAPGAVLDGRSVNQYAFGGNARGVRIDHLTIQGFGRSGTNNNEGVVNHDGASDWVMSHITVRGNAGAGILMGDGNVVEDSCLVDNGQYGFTVYSPGGVEDVTLRGNEIARNNTDDWEARQPGCGCSGGGKFWATVGGVVADNYVHDNLGVGLWADTNNAGFTFVGNHLADNDGPGLLYETSYNAAIRDNTFVRNGLASWRDNPGFPKGAVYISESGSDARVKTVNADVFDISGNFFLDNWGGVVAWENADRFAGSPANTSTGTSTLVNDQATVAACSDPEAVSRPPYRDDCRWKTQHLRVRGNVFRFSPPTLGGECTPDNLCGFTGLFSNYGTYPPWSPYKGTVVEEAVTFAQDNVWSDNAYVGPWGFMALEQGHILTWEEWRSQPFRQDTGSTLE